jgi:exopolysaccharide biosynthesis polyprenyl glycosylphosphotransferase
MIRTRQYVLAFGDLCALILSLGLMIIVRFGKHYTPEIVSAHVYSFIPLFILWIAFFFIFNLYDIRSVNPNPRILGRLALAIVTTSILGGFFFYVQPSLGISPHTNLLIVSFFAFILLIIWRRIFYILFADVFSRRIMIIGTSQKLMELVGRVKEQTPLGKITAQKNHASEITDGENMSEIDLVITDATDPKEIIALEKKIPARVITLEDAYGELFAKIPLALMTEEQATRIAIRATSQHYSLLVRLFEIAVAGITLIVLSPLLILTAIIKKLEDGGEILLHEHLRVGKNGKLFHLYKIRSMIMKAEADGAQWAEAQDPRITPFGKIIRKLHIDEIPQLFNVIKGDMALVGPRPERPEFVSQLEKEIPYYFLRHTIKPGFTGWAQIKFHYARSVAESQEKLEYDLYYTANRNFLLDIGILLKTIQIIFTH